MNWLDYLIIAIIVISVGVAVIRGFVKEVLSLANWVLAFWVAVTFLPAGEEFLFDYIGTPSVRTFSAFFILLVGSLILGMIVTSFAIKATDKLGLGSTDNVLGMVFGFVRGAAIIVILILLARATPIINDSWWKESTLRSNFEPVVTWAHAKLPTYLADKITLDASTVLTPRSTQPASGRQY